MDRDVVRSLAVTRPPRSGQQPPPVAPSRAFPGVWLGAVAVLALAGGGAWWWIGSGTPGAGAPPNVVLVTLDTTRADHLGAYGYAAARTPALDRLARDGVLFERAMAAAPTTLPAHVSLMTGRNPAAHGVRNNGMPLGSDVPTLAAAFRDAGYRTGAFVSAFVLDERFGVNRGFETYDDALDPPQGRSNDALERRGDRTVTAAMAWLRENASGAPDYAKPAPQTPFFLWVHLYDPHDPYDAPAPVATGAASPYDGEIAFVDSAVGTLLAALEQQGLTGNTIVAAIGDHGESLGEHGEATHGMFVYDAAMHVPALLAWPGHLPANTRVAPLVRSIDLGPTLLDLAGRPPLPGAAGSSLAPLVRGTGAAPASAYGETYFPQLFMNWAPLRSLREGRWKFIEAPSLELYDTDADPGETANLADREPDRVGRMRRALRAQLAAEERPAAAAGPDRDTQRKLAALGYVGGGATSPGDPMDRPDPKAMIGVFNQLRGANTALDEGRLDDAARVAAQVLATDPGNAFALLVLGRAERAQERYKEAARHFRAYLEQVPLSADAHHWLAICQLQLGDFDAALAEVELALAIDQKFAEARTLRGDLLVAAGRLEEGLHDLRAAVNVNPDRAAAHIALGRTLLATGDTAGGTEQMRYAVELATRLARAGRTAQASLVYQQLAAERVLPADVREAVRLALTSTPR